MAVVDAPWIDADNTRFYVPADGEGGQRRPLDQVGKLGLPAVAEPRGTFTIAAVDEARAIDAQRLLADVVDAGNADARMDDVGILISELLGHAGEHTWLVAGWAAESREIFLPADRAARVVGRERRPSGRRPKQQSGENAPHGLVLREIRASRRRCAPLLNRSI